MARCVSLGLSACSSHLQSGHPVSSDVSWVLFALRVPMCPILAACICVPQGEPQSSRPLLLHLPSLEQFLTEAMAGCACKEGRPAIITGDTTLGMSNTIDMGSTMVRQEGQANAPSCLPYPPCSENPSLPLQRHVPRCNGVVACPQPLAGCCLPGEGGRPPHCACGGKPEFKAEPECSSKQASG